MKRVNRHIIRRTPQSIASIPWKLKGGATHEELIKAVEQGNLALIKNLVANGADIHVNDDEALCEAAGGGHVDIVEYLVKNGANIHAKDNKALRKASMCGHENVVRYLVEKGADVHAKNDEALRNVCSDLYSDNDEDVILDIIKCLVEHGANVHANNNQALCDNAYLGYFRVCKYLVEHGANIHVNDDDPLRKAIHGYEEKETNPSDIIKYLIEQGSNVNLDQSHALRVFAAYGSIDDVKFLIEHGANNIRRAINYVRNMPSDDLSPHSHNNIKYLESLPRNRQSGVIDLLEEGHHYPDEEIEYLDQTFLGLEDWDDVKDKKFFYNVRQVNPTTNKIIKAFDVNTLEEIGPYKNLHKNPLDKKPWPLNKPSELRQILKLMPTSHVMPNKSMKAANNNTNSYKSANSNTNSYKSANSNTNSYRSDTIRTGASTSRNSRASSSRASTSRNSGASTSRNSSNTLAR